MFGDKYLGRLTPEPGKVRRRGLELTLNEKQLGENSARQGAGSV